MVRITGIDWERTNLSHTASHGLSQGDIEDFIFESDHGLLIEEARDDRFAVHGRMSSGEYVTAYVVPTTGSEFVVLCARLSSDPEKKRYKEVRDGKRHENSTAI